MRIRHNVRIEKDWLLHLKKALLLKRSKFFVWHIWAVSLRFQARKMKNFQNLEISANSVDSFSTKNLWNRRKVERTSYYYQKNVSLLFVKIETNLASVFSVKSWTRTFYLNGNSRGSVIQELIKFNYFLLYYTSNVQINNLIYLSSVIQNLRKENNIFQNLRTSVDLADSVLGYRGIGRTLDILLIWKFISK